MLGLNFKVLLLVRSSFLSSCPLFSSAGSSYSTFLLGQPRTKGQFLRGHSGRLSYSYSAFLSNQIRITSNMEGEDRSDVLNLELDPGPSHDLLKPPATCKGMMTLDREAFQKEVSVPSITLPTSDLGKVQKLLKPHYLRIIGIKPVEHIDPESVHSRILLNPDQVKDIDLPKIIQEIFPDTAWSEVKVGLHKVNLTYQNWKANEILDAVLPDDDDKFGGYTHNGHLIHVNLRDHLLPYKGLIGQVLLDKFPKTKTVVNKLGMIEDSFRVFPMEVIAGAPDTVVTLRENHCDFKFDFATVYWNSRLCTEHERIPKKFLRRGDTLFDVFAGVGPFAIPAGKQGVRVYANDLNPQSFKWLQVNVLKNKVSQFVQVYNMDGRVFIRDVVASVLRTSIEDFNPSVRFHVTMNLPGSAVEFLDSFWNLFPDPDLPHIVLPPEFQLVVHVYCFIKDKEGFSKKALNLVREHLGHDLSESDVVDVFHVRNVAPNKEMFRISFRVPHQILLSRTPSKSRIHHHGDNDSSLHLDLDHEPYAKRPCIEKV